jgi:hypothetical protein
MDAVRQLILELVVDLKAEAISSEVTGRVVTKAEQLDANEKATFAAGLIQLVNEIARTNGAGPMVVLQLCAIARAFLGDEAAMRLEDLPQLSGDAQRVLGNAQSNIPVSARGGTGPTLMQLRMQKK